MKRIFLSIIATIVMTSFAAYADNGKKPTSKKLTKIEKCKKAYCPTSCKKTICPNRPGCVCN